jgi:integrase
MIEHRKAPSDTDVELFGKLCALVADYDAYVSIGALGNTITALLASSGMPKPEAIQAVRDIAKDMEEIVILHCNERPGIKKKEEEMDAKFLELLLANGVSLEEARNLRWEDIDFANKKMTLRSGGANRHERRRAKKRAT